MATIQRPVKTYGTRSYTAEVAAAPGNEDPILASEVDSDLDTIYSAWNGGTDTVNLKDGCVTFAKLAPDAQLWRDTGTALTPGVNFASRPLVIPADPAKSSGIVLGSATAKARWQVASGASGGANGLFANRDWGNTNAQDDATKPSWAAILNAGADTFIVQRSPAGSTTQTSLLTLDSAGSMTFGASTVKAMLQADGTQVFLHTNNGFAPQDAAKSSWLLYMSHNNDNAGFARRAPSAGSGVFSYPVAFDSAGNFTISGATATKASGTTWANPSDRRLKDDITDYTTGLAAILDLIPRTFVYNGKGGSTAGMRGYGFIADEIAPVMSETVGVRAGKLDPDDENETDIQTLDQSNLILALVNAVKELATRVTALEGAAA